jgi:hypothetical protein
VGIKLNGTHQLLVYAGDTVLLGIDINTKKTLPLLEASK